MRKGIRPLAIILLIIAVIAAFVLAFFVKGILPGELKRWSDLIFWGIVIIIGWGGALLAGRLCGRR